MPHIKPLLRPDAPSESRVVYDDFYKKMSLPAAPNFIMTQGHAPSVARGTWDLVRNVLVGGRIPRWVKEVMFVAISQDRHCGYCTAAHYACCRMLGVDFATLEQLAKNVESIGDPRIRDMVQFAVKCARNPQSLSAADYDGLRKHQLAEAEILEVIAMSALAVYANILADATQMEADRMFTAPGSGG